MLGVELERNRYFSLRADYAQRVISLVRTAEEFHSIESVDESTTALARAFPRARRLGFAMLVDYRLAPLSVAPVLEMAFARFRVESEQGFESVVVIVQSPIGRVRARRLTSAGSCPVEVVESMELALTYIARERVMSSRLQDG